MKLQTVSSGTSLRGLWKRPCGEQAGLSCRPPWIRRVSIATICTAEKKSASPGDTVTSADEGEGTAELLATQTDDRTERIARSSQPELDAERAVKKVAATFAPRPSGRVKNPATPGVCLDT